MAFYPIGIFVFITFIATNTAYPLDQFYPFGSAASDNLLHKNDDEYSSRISIPVMFPFFGSLYDSFYVST